MFWRPRKNRDQDLERELRSYLESEAQEQQESGLPAKEARRAARRQLGNSTRIKEQVREAWGFSWFERLSQDVAYALRLFRRTPGFAAIIVLTLVLGIAANTAVFTILHAVLLQPLPYPNPDRLIVIWDREIHVKGISKLFDLYSDYENWKQNSSTFAALAAFSWSPQASPEKILTGSGPARKVFALPVTPDFFSVLRVPAMLGRTFKKIDTRRGCMVVLEHSFWQTHLGGRETIIGKPVRLDDQVCTVIGVMPPGFAFLPPEAPVSMWITMPRPVRPSEFAVGVFARLRPGVSLASAQAEVSLLHHHIHGHDLWGAKMEPVIYELHEEFTWLTGRNLRLTLIVLFAAVNLVILICCVNIANLLLARAVEREREMAIRAALASGRSRLLRQLFTENLLFSLVAVVVGTGLATAAVQYFRIARPVTLPPGADLTLNTPVLAFAAALGLLTAIIFGLMPAWKASRIDLNEVLKITGRTVSRGLGQQRFGRFLIVAEVALTVVLLAGAGLLIKTLNGFASAPLGFKPNGLFTTSLRLPATGYEKPERRIEAYERIQADLTALPAVQGVAFSSERPIEGGGAMNVIEVEGHAKPRLDKAYDTFGQTVSPDYFRVMQIPLRDGRFFEKRDTQRSEPVAIINQVLVQKYFPRENPIGKYLRPFTGDDKPGPWLKVVGVVGNEKRTTVYQEMAWADSPVIYRPVTQNPNVTNIIVRISAGPGAALAGRIQRTIAAIDPDIPVDNVQTVSALEAKALAYPRFRPMLLGTFALVALILSVVGLLGVLSHSVAQRTHEIGVRMALGARDTMLLTMILREGFALTTAGMVLGIGLAWLLGRYLAALLYGVRPTDPYLIAAVALVLMPAALIAIYLPARRASKVDPIVALRYE